MNLLGLVIVAGLIFLSYNYVEDYFRENILQSECRGTSDCIKGVVTNFIDGDTIEVDGETVRLALIDTPERDEEGYQEAIDFIKEICKDKLVVVDEDDGQPGGSFGRIVGVVLCDDVNLNDALLEEGHAVLLEEFCDVSEFGLDEWAQRNGCKDFR